MASCNKEHNNGPSTWGTASYANFTPGGSKGRVQPSRGGLKLENTQQVSTSDIVSTLGYIHQILFQYSVVYMLGAHCLRFSLSLNMFLNGRLVRELNCLQMFIVIKHSVNTFFLLGKTFLSSLYSRCGICLCRWPFPFFDSSPPCAHLWYATQPHRSTFYFGYYATKNNRIKFNF
ncbi:LOW QUALITY PROTEIN: hypothetical protein HID58_041762, partial [Brassica napus]